LHETDRTRRDADREETFPADQRFFADIAAACSDAGRIIIIGHDKGQSNKVHHLLAWQDSHRRDIQARIAREIVADLPHMAAGELLDAARHALATPDPEATLIGAPS